MCAGLWKGMPQTLKWKFNENTFVREGKKNVSLEQIKEACYYTHAKNKNKKSGLKLDFFFFLNGKYDNRIPFSLCKPVWPSGKLESLGWKAEGPRFGPLRLSFLFKTCVLWTLSGYFAHTINETLKWLTQLPTLMQSHSGGDSVASRC